MTYDSNLIIYSNVAGSSEMPLSLVGGIVKKISNGTGKASGKVVNILITGKQYIKEADAVVNAAMDIGFWNNGDGSGKNYMDQALAKNIVIGSSFISTLCHITERKLQKDKDGKITGVLYKGNGRNIKYTGVWKFAEKVNETTGIVSSEKNILIGRVLSVIEKPDAENPDRVMVSMSLFKDKEIGNTWHNATFWKTDKKNQDLREDVIKCLKTEKNQPKPFAIITCGREETYKNDSNYTAFQFRVVDIPEKRAKAAEASAAAADADAKATEEAPAAPETEPVATDKPVDNAAQQEVVNDVAANAETVEETATPVQETSVEAETPADTTPEPTVEAASDEDDDDMVWDIPDEVDIEGWED